MKASMKRIALKTAQGLALLSLLALLALVGAGMSRSLSAGAQIAATNGDIHVNTQAATNGDIHITTQVATNGDIFIGSTIVPTWIRIAAKTGDVHVGS